MLSENDAILELKKVSAYAGNKMDLIQSGAGNTSAKTSDKMMYVKASGFKLRDLADGKGIACVSCPQAWQTTGEDFVEWNDKCVNSAAQLRPSIEVSMHALLGGIVMHTHPVLALGFLCAENSQRLVDEIFPGSNDVIYLPYAKPGIELGVLLRDALRKKSSGGYPVVLLENHGVVAHGATAAEAIVSHEKVLDSFRRYGGKYSTFHDFEPLNPENHINTGILNAIRAAVPEFQSMVCIRVVDGMPSKGILFPDAAVFCGGNFVELPEDDKSPVSRIDDILRKFKASWHQPPHIWKIGDYFVCAAKTLEEAGSVAEVWWAHENSDAISRRISRPRYLSVQIIHDLLNWEAERYRKNLSEGELK